MWDKEKALEELKYQAEDLKSSIWNFMETDGVEHKGLKESVNEMLDLIDELDL